jgi:hypothetical protein
VGKPGWKVGYADGRVSAWPAAAYTRLTQVIPHRITVLADPGHDIFDHEAGNAPAHQVATAVEARLKAGKWSICYTNHAELAALEAALHSLGLNWTPAAAWPGLGVYLWASAPGTTPGHIPGWCPTAPVAVQDRWEKDWDVSSVYGPFPAATARPGPAPAPVPRRPPPAPGPAPGVCAVNLPVLKQGSKGAAVQAAQKLLGGIAADGDFGPATHNRTVAVQAAARLAADGIIGTHTWGHLLGAPQ